MESNHRRTRKGIRTSKRTEGGLDGLAVVTGVGMVLRHGLNLPNTL